MIVRGIVVAMLMGLTFFTITRDQLPNESHYEETVSKPIHHHKTPSKNYDWILPESWAPKPLTMMRLASFASSNDGDIGIFEFPGTQNVVDNINRWREQLNLPVASAEDINTELTSLSAPIGTFTTCTILGDSRLVLGAILQFDDKALVITLKGPREQLDNFQGPFVRFIESIKDSR